MKIVKRLIIILTLLIVLVPNAAYARSSSSIRLSSFDTHTVIKNDGSIDVTEALTFDFSPF